VRAAVENGRVQHVRVWSLSVWLQQGYNLVTTRVHLSYKLVEGYKIEKRITEN
jgi:hypothetical protein